MSLITKYRPKHLNGVIGQPRVLRVLTGALTYPQYMTRGFVFSGHEGLGKTTVAYLFAKAIMCRSENPLTCVGCPSCDSFTLDDRETLIHPDFDEVDAASVSGVEAARTLVESSKVPAHIARRRVIVIEEAHRLSKEAWDVYLRPLELGDTEAVFIYPTTEPRAIPKTIASRCINLTFDLVLREDITGLLMTIADQEGIPYTLDGLRYLAELSKGKCRGAINLLQFAALAGQVTKENCAALIQADATDAALKVFNMLIQAAQAEKPEPVIADVLALVDRTGQMFGPTALIEALFAVYARKFFEDSPIAKVFSRHKDITALFLKWTQVKSMPVDALPLMVMELVDLMPGRQQQVFATPTQRQNLTRLPRTMAKPQPTTAAPTGELSHDDFDSLIGASA